MDFFIEFLLEAYLSIFEILVPENKFKKWQETLLKLLCVFVCLIILGCFAAGIVILIEGAQNLYAVGVALVCVGSVLFAVQVALVIVTIVHDVKKERAKKKKLLEADLQELLEDSEDI